LIPFIIAFVDLWIFYDEKIKKSSNKQPKEQFGKEPKCETCRLCLLEKE